MKKLFFTIVAFSFVMFVTYVLTTISHRRVELILNEVSVFLNVRILPDNSKSQISTLLADCNFIAHAGGEIDGIKYTNSVEAIQNSIDNGYNIIEIDMLMSSDGRIIAAHSWDDVYDFTGLSYPNVAYSEFLSESILSKYSPIGEEQIQNLFSVDSRLVLVTDKIDDYNKLSKTFRFKDRIVVEVFDNKGYKNAISNGFNNVALNVDINKKSIVSFLKINNVKAITYRGDDIQGNYESLRNAIEISKSGIKALIYSYEDMDISGEWAKKIGRDNFLLYSDSYRNVNCL